MVEVLVEDNAILPDGASGSVLQAMGEVLSYARNRETKFQLNMILSQGVSERHSDERRVIDFRDHGCLKMESLVLMSKGK